MVRNAFKKSAVLVALAAVASAGVFGTMAISAAAESRTIALDAASVKGRDTPPLIGVGVHFGIGGEYGFDPAKTADALKALGLTTYRDDLPWDVFDWPDPSYYKVRKARIFDMTKLSGARPVFIIGHPNATVPNGNPPLNDEGRKAFVDYATRATQATAAFKPIYEIWNEWNMNAIQGQKWLRGPGEASDPRAAVNYTALAKATVPAIRKADPEATIIVGAVGVDDRWEWTRAMVNMGALDGADGISVHLYNHCEADLAKRTATEMVDRLNDLQSFLSDKNGGKPYPVYVTEFGWPIVPKPCVVTPKAASDNIAQMILWSSTVPWLKGQWIYSIKDKGRNPEEMEDNFGLYDYEYKPKPQACPTKEAAALVTGPHAAFALERPFPDVFVLYSKGEKGLRMIAWTSRDEVKARISAPNIAAAHPLCGAALPAGASVEIGGTPVVIDLGSETATVDVVR